MVPVKLMVPVKSIEGNVSLRCSYDGRTILPNCAWEITVIRPPNGLVGDAPKGNR